ncbi:hypothetical protein [Pseudomonas fluorescens]|uniref:Uncharacterized protein n=1 Tax=Pseudomonas fluorescens TaxID=294 RepID=A0A5E7N5C5_PSEFL|nr:hypothetical protein [Pseudomonas fluorescens]VVP32311.1 hypothetical protein PS880_04405 [Pseudomonas fluorescens]
MKRLIGGQPLYTKDECVFSNASVICVGNSGKSITYQIRSEHGNIGVLKEYEIEQWFNLQPLNEKTIELSINATSSGFSLAVAPTHAENIRAIVSEELYSFDNADSYVGTFYVNSTNWKRFSELLCLTDVI